MKTSTKMYLSIFLSTACILFYQYQLSKANLLAPGNVDHIDNEVSNNLRHTTTISSTTTTTTTTSLPLISTTEKTVNTLVQHRLQKYCKIFVFFCIFCFYHFAMLFYRICARYVVTTCITKNSFNNFHNISTLGE